MLVIKNNIYKFVTFRQDWLLIISLLAITIVVGLVPSIASILIGRCFKIFTNIYYGQYKTYSIMYDDLVLRTMSLVILAAAYFPVSWISITLSMRFGEIQNYRIRSTIFKNYMLKDLNYFDTHENLTAEFVQTNRCIEELRQSCSEATGIAFQSLVSMVALICVACYYSWSLTLVFLCSAPLIALVATVCSKKYEKYTDLENNESMRCSEQILNIMENIKLIKINMTEKEELDKFNKQIKNCNDFFIKGSFWTSINQAILKMLSLCMFVQGFWFGASEIKKGRLSTEKVIICFSSCISLSSTLMSLIHQIIIIQKGKVALKFVDKLFDSDLIENKNNSKDISLPLPQDLSNKMNNLDIEFNNVTSSYISRPDVKVLNHVNLSLAANELCFVVGKSGSGKSTLFNLLLKLYDNKYEGEISLNSVNIREIPTNWLLSQITLVEQHTHLFNDTLRNNLLLGSDLKDKDSENFFEEVIEIAQLKEVIDILPKGLDTVMGESFFKEDEEIDKKSKEKGNETSEKDDDDNNNNITLSGGQQQRVAIARALLRNTPIIVFDESLSAVDIKTRHLIMKKLKKHRRGKTTIMLTHDLACIDNENNVYVMESGAVREFGTKEQLMSTNSIFKQMYDLQTLYQKEQLENNIDDNISFTDSFTKQSLELNPFDSNLDNTLSSPETQKNLTISTAKRISKFFDNDSKAEYVDEKFTDFPLEAISYENYESPSRLPLTSLTKIFKAMYNTITNKFYLILGLIAAVISGVSNPVFSWADAKLINANVLQGKTSSTNDTMTTNSKRLIELVSVARNANTDLSSSAASPSSGYMVKWCMIVIAIAAIDGISTFLKEYLLQCAAETWIMNLRHLSFKNILNNQLDWFSFALNKPSEVSALLMNDLRDVRTLVSQFLTVVVTVIFVSLGGLIWAIVSGWKLSLVGLSLIPLYIITTIFYTFLLQKMENLYKTSIANLENKQYEILKNFKTIKILQLESTFKSQLDTCYNKLSTIGIKRTYNTGLGVAIFSSLTYIVQAIIIFYGLKLVIIGEYSTAKLFVTFSLLLFTIVTCAMLSASVPDLARGQRGATYSFQLINNSMPEINPLEAYKPINYEKIDECIMDFENVKFLYPATTKVIFKNLSFKIEKGKNIGIVGPSGSGKSTITNLLAKFQDVNSGSIKINNENINNWDLKTLREFIVFVEQKGMIFRGTLRDNLTYGNNATTEEILNLIDYFHLGSLLKQLNGLDDGFVDIGLVSGGQLQRINIIRQILRLKGLEERCQIAVMDEITSSLDPETGSLTEDYIIKNIFKTKLLITHHKSLMMKCDKLLVFNQFGELKEFDNFTNLANNKDSYFNKLISEFD